MPPNIFTATFKVSSPKGLAAPAAELIRRAGKRRVFALTGPMGVGKTALTHALLRTLGVKDRGSSPSYSLVNEYLAESGDPVYHFDFYRIEDLEEVYDIGYEMYFYSGHYCFVEWADKIEPLLPEDTVYVNLTHRGTHRKIEAKGLAYP